MHPQAIPQGGSINRPTMSSWFRGPLSVLSFFVVYVVGAELGHWMSAEPGHFATFWPNSGLFLAVLLRFPPHRWWVMVLAGSTANLTSDLLLHSQRVDVALGFMLANTVEAMLGAAVVRVWLGPSLGVDNLRNVLGLVVATAAFSTPLAGLIGAATVSAAFGVPFLQTWQVWWVADGLGVLLIAPLVLNLHDLNGWPRTARLLEGTAVVAGLVVAGVYVFTTTPLTAPIILLLFLLWAAVRLGIPGVAVATFVLAVVTVRYTILGHGLYAELGTPLERVAAVQVFVAVAALLFYCFAVVLDERKQAEASLEERVQERQAFLLKLSDTLRTEPDEGSIKDATVRMLAEHLSLDRCWISEVFAGQGYSTVGPESFRADLPPMAGEYRLSDYPETMRHLATQPMVIDDAAGDPRFSEAERALLAQLRLRALLVVPLRKGPEVIFALATAMATPRRWAEDERVLLEEVAERMWAAVERAKAEAQLRASEDRSALLVRFADAARGLSDPGRVAEAACRLLTARLGTERTLWAGIDWAAQEYVAECVVLADGTRSEPSRWPLDPRQPFAAEHLAGRAVAYDDVTTDPRIPDPARAVMAERGVRAGIAVPVLVGGTLRAVLRSREKINWSIS